MSFLYLVALVGVAVAIACALAEAVLAVSRKSRWQLPRHALSLVSTADRRTRELPFVGAERRDVQVPAGAEPSSIDRQAA